MVGEVCGGEGREGGGGLEHMSCMLVHDAIRILEALISFMPFGKSSLLCLIVC